MNSATPVQTQTAEAIADAGMMLELGSARGGKRPAADLTAEIARTLTPADLPMLVAPPPVGATPPTLVALRHTHHLLAQLLAKGHSQTEAAAISGYSVSRVSILCADPTFRELLEHYRAQREIAFVDVMERMAALGLHSLEELQARIDEKPEEFTARELIELAELMLVKGRAQAGGAPAAAAPLGVQVNVQFVSAKPQIEGEPGMVIEGDR
jgi:hypothetical protein